MQKIYLLQYNLLLESGNCSLLMLLSNSLTSFSLTAINQLLLNLRKFFILSRKTLHGIIIERKTIYY